MSNHHKDMFFLISPASFCVSCTLDQNNSLVFDNGNDGVLCASRLLWKKWKFLSLLFYCFLMPPPSFLVPLPPSSCASLSSSPCNSSFVSLCSLPSYNQVFFMLLCKVWIGPMLLFRSSLLHRLASFSLTLFHYISNDKTLGNVSLSRRHCYLWSIGIHSAGLYVLASTLNAPV